MRIMMALVCQPDAASPPRMLASPPSCDRCIGCGSNSLAKSTISSASTVIGLNSNRVPGEKSSKCSMARSSDTGAFVTGGSETPLRIALLLERQILTVDLDLLRFVDGDRPH